MKVSISLPEELVHYVDRHVDNRSQLVETLLSQWRKQQEQSLMVEACLELDTMNMGWDEECERAAITDWEVSG